MEILRESWTKVAAGYRNIFVPRFSPWIKDAVQALARAAPPCDGTVFVAGCGSGEEVVSAAKLLPDHNFEAFDLADGMVAISQELIHSNGLSKRVKVAIGDATSVPLRLQPVSGILSCFVLQQMPRPAQVVASWTRSLAPNGVLCVCYWPNEVESEGPWRRMMDIDPPKSKEDDWERDIPALALRDGAEIISDQRISHTIDWDSAEAFWTGSLYSAPCGKRSDLFFLPAMTEAGPWNARLLRLGEERMLQLRSHTSRAQTFGTVYLMLSARMLLAAMIRSNNNPRAQG